MFNKMINNIIKQQLDVYGIEVFHKGEVIFSHYFKENTIICKFFT